MDLTYLASSFKRDTGNFTELPLINMFAEKEPSLASVSLLSRPGLRTLYEAGPGPVRAMYQKDGTLNANLYIVNGDKLRSGTTNLGTITISGVVSMDAYANLLWVCGNDRLYTYDGTVVTPNLLPDDKPVAKVLVGSSRAVAIQKNSQTIYWTDPMGSVFDALSYAQAEYLPDNIRDALFVGDTLVLFGSNTTEFWPASSANPDLPFAPLAGRVFQYGVKNLGAACTFKNTFAWVSHTNTIFLGTPDSKISFPGLDELIESQDGVFLWTFELNGIDFLALRLSTETWVYNSGTETWSQFVCDSESNFVPSCGIPGLFGSGVDGRIMEWSDDCKDFGRPLERRFRAGAELNSGVLKVDNLIARVNSGQTLSSTATISMRTSKDGGFTFNPWRTQSLGVFGDYRQQPRWIGLGAFSYPGFLVEFKVTDPIPLAVSGTAINESMRGV